VKKRTGEAKKREKRDKLSDEGEESREEAPSPFSSSHSSCSSVSFRNALYNPSCTLSSSSQVLPTSLTRSSPPHLLNSVTPFPPLLPPIPPRQSVLNTAESLTRSTALSSGAVETSRRSGIARDFPHEAEVAERARLIAARMYRRRVAEPGFPCESTVSTWMSSPPFLDMLPFSARLASALHPLLTCPLPLTVAKLLSHHLRFPSSSPELRLTAAASTGLNSALPSPYHSHRLHL
jgi:hypothetical protein